MPEQYFLTVSKDGVDLFSSERTAMRGKAMAAYKHLNGRLPATEGYTIEVFEVTINTRTVTADFR